MKGIKPIFRKIIYICLVLVFIIITALLLLIYFGPRQVDINKPIILISADEMVGLSDEDIVSRLFTMRLQHSPYLQGYKIENVKKRKNRDPISFDVRFLIKPDSDPDSYVYWAAGASTHYEDGWLGKTYEVELIKENNQYRIEIILP